jgi:2,3-bisphosphoglycerate-independent phosphoglycerate mutase
MKTKKVLLVITDGIGHRESCKDNAFCNANKTTYDYLFENVPYNYVKTSGLAVGLPQGQMGNSEVGHMSIGSGRVLYQNLVKISKAIEEDRLKEMPVVKDIMQKSADIHVVGLLSDGGVHSHIDHLIAMAKIGAQYGKKVYLHLITDGRDVAPDSAGIYIDKILENLDENISIATLSGRFYSMDRDTRWDRVERGYRAMAFANPKTALDVKAYVAQQYEKEILDEFIEPVAFGDYDGFGEGDGVIFVNFRSDRMRELVTAIGDEAFAEFQRNPATLHLATMTQYNKEFPYPVIFEECAPKNTLAEVISKAGLTQLHTSETEKYAHVTFFFNGGVEEPFLNESRVLVPSPDVKTYDMKPEMSAPQVSENVQKALRQGYDFVVVNFANGDMVGHTGNYEAGIKAVEAVDKELGKLIEVCKEEGYSMVLTSDHGNCEEMKNGQGERLTNHTTYEVFCFVMAEGVGEVKEGGLNNIAPTVLKLMNLPIPEEMDAPLI